MKKIQMPFVLIIIISVFMLSFLMGRATALKDKDGNAHNTEIYNGTIKIPKEEEETAPAAANAQKVKKEDSADKKENDSDFSASNTPPERMLFPCGNNVINGYSQTAVYSKTMNDWRAHTGIDYAAEKGAEVVSAWDGIVKKVYKDKLWGYCVEILHTGNIRGIYRNLQKKISVKEGDKLKGGQAIGKVGTSAPVEKEEEPHLHFELWADGVPINPESYVY